MKIIFRLQLLVRLKKGGSRRYPAFWQSLSILRPGAVNSEGMGWLTASRQSLSWQERGAPLDSFLGVFWRGWHTWSVYLRKRKGKRKENGVADDIQLHIIIDNLFLLGVDCWRHATRNASCGL